MRAARLHERAAELTDAMASNAADAARSNELRLHADVSRRRAQAARDRAERVRARLLAENVPVTIEESPS